MLIAGVVLLISALPVQRTRVSDFETDLFYAVNGLPDLLSVVLETIMQFGNFLIVPVITLGAVVLRRFRLAADLAVAGTSAWLLAKVVKQLVVRGRPAELLSDVIVRGAPGAGHGYVSGHTATAAALAAVITPYLPKRFRKFVWLIAALVGIARMYVGAHLPLDVIGGAAMGWAIGSLVHFLLGPPDPQGA
jgi:undecaprenyl-diphosphatase